MAGLKVDKANSPVHFSQMDCAFAQVCSELCEPQRHLDGQKAQAVAKVLLQFGMTCSKLSLQRKKESQMINILPFSSFLQYTPSTYSQSLVCSPLHLVFLLFSPAISVKKVMMTEFLFLYEHVSLTKCSGGGIFILLLHLSTFTLKCFFFFFLAHYTLQSIISDFLLHCIS